MENKRIWSKMGLWLAAALLVLGLAACGSNEDKSSPSPSATESASPSASASPESSPSASSSEETAASSETVYPLTLKDSTGTDVVFEQAPERVVTLAPSETEVMFAIGSGAKVVAVDNYSDYPEEAQSLEKVGDINTNLEALLAAKPDVVLAHSGMQANVIEELRKLNVKVFASDPKTLEQVMEKIGTVGQIMNAQEGAAQVVATMKDELKRVTDALQGVAAKKVYMEFSPGWTVGSGEYMDEILTLAGGDNVSKEKSGWFEVDPEAVIKSNPEVILYALNPNYDLGILQAIKDRPGFDAIDAVKNNRMFAVDDNSISRVGPRLTKVLYDMAKAIHPDKVK
ncbi:MULTISPECIES: ABC transporter substrate-binding protein [Cohnella]|uniref:Iron complex transport system substrate-binding protein n=1 Tax=Cohnella phaseoli TaxID=456490 RepID=A0A3D9KT08_9BACL|nr:ABC transporter substrate-binding protein [Cohnella phaseoli]RED89309.1 iron complex transport system substrate-binding protein [Cohnella phaseoli]